MRADDPKLKKLEPPRLNLLERFYLIQVAAGLGGDGPAYRRRDVRRQGHHDAVSRGAARPERQLPGRAPAQQG